VVSKSFAAYLVLGLTVSISAPADARDGCGAGTHRGAAGRCRPNLMRRGPVVVLPGLVIGRRYEGRGYWDGHRYWARREHNSRHWRYRD